MKHNFTRTFDAVKMPREHQEKIREALSLRASEAERESNSMNTKSPAYRKLKVALIAAAITLSCLLLAGFAYGTQIIQMLGGGRIEVGQGYISMSLHDEIYPYEVREGRVYFMLDGSGKDITGYCSEDTFYLYERTNDNGYRHVMLIGGTPDNLGWIEFVWDENGDFLGYSAINASDETLPWLKKGREQLGFVAWGGADYD